MFLIHPDIYYRHDHSVQQSYEEAEPDWMVEESDNQPNVAKTIAIAGVALTTLALLFVVMSQVLVL